MMLIQHTRLKRSISIAIALIAMSTLVMVLAPWVSAVLPHEIPGRLSSAELPKGCPSVTINHGQVHCFWPGTMKQSPILLGLVAAAVFLVLGGLFFANRRSHRTGTSASPSAVEGELSSLRFHRCARSAAVVAGTGASLFVAWFHHNQPDAMSLAVLYFFCIAAASSYAITYLVAKARFEKTVPTIGFLRGAGIAVSTFLLSVTVHTAFFPGQGGFLRSILPILGIGLAIFGWLIALVGGGVGWACERKYFAPKPSADGACTGRPGQAPHLIR